MEMFVSFSEIMHYFKRNVVKFAVVVLAFGIVAGLLPLKFHTFSYSGSTTLTISCAIPDNSDADYRNQYAGIINNRVQTAIAWASTNDLIKETAKKVGVDPSQISKIAAEQVGAAPVVKLTASTPNAEKAAEISDTAAQIVAQKLSDQFPSPKITAAISDKSLPAQGQSRKASMLKSGLLGLIIGFIVFVCFGILAVLTDRTIRNSRYVAEALKTKLLAEIPHENGKDRSDAFRKMRAAVLHQAGDAKSFLVADVGENNGGDITAAEFAASVSQTGKKVLAVDADFRSPKLAEIFGVKPEKTLADVLKGSCEFQQAAVPVPSKSGLSLIAAAPIADADPADLLAGPNFSKLMAQAVSLYDFVIVYAPSETRFPEADNVASQTQAVVLSVRYGSTPYIQLKDSLRSVATAGGRVVGFVMTNA